MSNTFLQVKFLIGSTKHLVLQQQGELSAVLDTCEFGNCKTLPLSQFEHPPHAEICPKQNWCE